MNSPSTNRSRLKTSLSQTTREEGVSLYTPADSFMKNTCLLKEWESKIIALNTKRVFLKDLLKKERTYYDQLKEEVEIYTEASGILKVVLKRTQSSFAVRLADITTLCLNSIMDRPYVLSVHFRDIRNKTEISFTLDRGLKSFKDPLNSIGGGIIDIVHFSLRVSCLLLAQPPLRKVLFLDEPFRHLSKKLQPKAGKMIDRLSKDLGIDFLIITHDDRLVDDIDCTLISLD